MEDQNLFDIRYLKLTFTLQMTKDTALPRHKASALRGGMGEMLLRMHCIRDRNCAACDFESECLVRRTMYSKMEIAPAFMQEGNSVGYVIACEDDTEQFNKGDELRFQLLLFGKTIVYFSQFLQAFQHLGLQGLGKNRSNYTITRITGTGGEEILDGTNIFMGRLKIRMLSDYIDYRCRRMGQSMNDPMYLVLHTPLSLKYQGKMLYEWNAEAVLRACARRLYMLQCFEGIRTDETDVAGHIPALGAIKEKRTQVRRYSSTHDEKIALDGFYGTARITGVDGTALHLLLAGELLHIGKNTSFGFGRYTLLTETEASHG